ncbi:class III chitinase ChiA2 [Metarhizium album ARSEF 1941]|uniref:Class III chitinase ChiA2 n=1 Tax=Metarhizium album (strain ARSEF 1941) TaxID=1081103 RepID=A0A0B2WP91_METAS|nr:class III chitinase ChiA2 [Metarhizium album ARSEF 1941]KHN95484.1 class III chitinase ChiA2 [Metarhizium album ARSEF 1941]
MARPASILRAVAGLVLLAGTSLAAPPRRLSPRAAGGQTVVYWGQNGGGGAVENNDLAAYCTGQAGIDIVVLAFLYQFGNGNKVASGSFGRSCVITPAGEGQNCDDLARAIDTCKANGVKVILSLGGAAGTYALTSQEEAEAVGQSLWDAYGTPGGGGGGPAAPPTPRPFGKTFVDGWDFDIETSSGSNYYPFLIAKLRSNFAAGARFLITGAPQCPVPEPNMNAIIAGAQFDYLWVQFYNNPGCSVDGPINYDAWKANVANTPSARASIFIGVPASPLGATGTAAGARYYLEPGQLAALVARYSGDGAFGGVMMWSAAFSDANVNNGCTYAQQAKRILTTGQAC